MYKIERINKQFHIINLKRKKFEGWGKRCYVQVSNIATAEYIIRCMKNKRIPQAKSYRRFYYLYEKIKYICDDEIYIEDIEARMERKKTGYRNVNKGKNRM